MTESRDRDAADLAAARGRRQLGAGRARRGRGEGRSGARQPAVRVAHAPLARPARWHPVPGSDVVAGSGVLHPRDRPASERLRCGRGRRPAARWSTGLPSGAPVLVDIDADLGTYPEIRYATRAALADLYRQGANLAIVSFSAEGRAIAVAEIDRLRDLGAGPDRLVDLGFRSGGEPALVQLAGNGIGPTATGPLADALRKSGPGSFRLALVIGGAEIGPRSWVEQVQPRLPNLPIAAITPSFLLPEVLPYRSSGQLIALVGTLPARSQLRPAGRRCGPPRFGPGSLHGSRARTAARSCSGWSWPSRFCWHASGGSLVALGPCCAAAAQVVNGFFETGSAGTVATWLAVLVTLCVWSYLVGERRLLRTGPAAPRRARDRLPGADRDPRGADSAADHAHRRPRRRTPSCCIDLLLVAVLVAGRWLPRRLVAVPAAILRWRHRRLRPGRSRHRDAAPAARGGHDPGRRSAGRRRGRRDRGCHHGSRAARVPARRPARPAADRRGQHRTLADARRDWAPGSGSCC